MAPGWPRLLLLLVTASAPGAGGDCEVGSANECKRARPAPGVDLLGEGYDVVRLRRTGAYAVDVSSWRLAGGACTLCRNALMGGAAQRLPRAAVDWRVRQECRRQLTSTLLESAAELEASGRTGVDQSWSAGLDVQPSPNAGARAVTAGSHSREAEFGRKRAASDRYTFASQEFRCQLYECRLAHRPPLAPQFRQLLRGLPRRLGPDTRFFYQRFLHLFGTHYIRAARLGGLFRDVTAMRTCQVASEGLTVEEVKDCLEIEAELRVSPKAEASAKFKNCQEAREKMESKRSFHQTYSDRQTELTGGTAAAGVDLFFSPEPSALAAWLETLAAHPGVIYHVLEPLHLLVSRGDPRHALLRRAVSEHIVQAGRGGNCSRPDCGPSSSSHADPRDLCSCSCREDGRVDRLCCSKGKGWAQLEVRVGRARDLWGDYTSATDGYVKASCGGRLEAATRVVPNNNNPVWDTRLDLGHLQLGPEARLRLEAWDRDSGHDDDLLGACERPLTSGPHSEVCYFSYGSLTFDFTLTCGPHLGGATCHDYVASPGG